MAYTIVKDYVPAAKYARKCPYTMKAKSITVHNTWNDAPAVNEVTYMKNNDKYVSFHDAVDDKEVRLAVPHTRNTFHAGDGKDGKGNRTSIGIEICYSRSGGKKYEMAEENAVHYIASLLKQYGWGVDRVKQHYDWSRKNCPHRIRDEKRWASFIKRIEAALNKLNGFSASVQPSAATPTPPVETPAPTKDYSNRIGRIEVAGEAKTWRMQTSPYATPEKRDEAQERLLEGLWSYAESKVFTDGIRLQSGAYQREKGWTYEAVHEIAKFMIDANITNYVTIYEYA